MRAPTRLGPGLLTLTALLACAATREAQVTAPLFPAGTTQRPAPGYPAAIAWKVPAGLSFELQGPPEVSASQVLLRGVLRNASDQEAEVIVLPSGSGGAFHAELRPTAEVDYWRADDPERPNLPPRPPPAPPPPMAFSVPAHGQVAFQAPVELMWFRYRGSPEVEVQWTFLFWNEPKPRGSLKVRLPPR